jgi:acylphosphatase
MVAESSPASLADFIRLAHARDDPVIRVEDIVVTNSPATEEFHHFRAEW